MVGENMMKQQICIILNMKAAILKSYAIKNKTMKNLIYNLLMSKNAELKICLIILTILTIWWLIDPNYNNY